MSKQAAPTAKSISRPNQPPAVIKPHSTPKDQAFHTPLPSTFIATTVDTIADPFIATFVAYLISSLAIQTV